jgi:hypothetical protein
MLDKLTQISDFNNQHGLLKLALRWRLLTLGTSTEGDEIWLGSPSSTMYQFASPSECFRCVCSLVTTTIARQ